MKHLYRISESHSEKIPTVQYGSKDVFSSISMEVESEKALTDKQLIKMQEKVFCLTREACQKEADLIREDRQPKTQLPSHRYDIIDGKSCPHVTNIITPETPKIPHIEEHAAQGTWLDGCFKNLIEEGILSPTQDAPHTPNIGSVADLYDKASKWVTGYCKDGKVELDSHSTKVMNRKYWFCGELDAIGKYHGKPAIFDFKKTKNLKNKQLVEKYFMQMAAYSLHDNLHIEPSFLVICSPYNPPMATENIKEYQEKFLALRKQYKQTYKV